MQCHPIVSATLQPNGSALNCFFHLINRATQGGSSFLYQRFSTKVSMVVLCVFFLKNLTTFTTQLLTVGNLFCKLFRSVGVCCIVCLIRVKIYPLRWGEVGLDGWRRADSKQEEDPTYGSNVQVLQKTFAALPGKAAHVPEVFEFVPCCRCCCCPSPRFSVPCIGQEIQLLTFEGFTRETIRQWHSECVQITMYSFLRQIPQCDSQLCAIILQRRKFWGKTRKRDKVSSQSLARQFRSVRRSQYGMVWCTVLVTIWATFASICKRLPVRTDAFVIQAEKMCFVDDILKPWLADRRAQSGYSGIVRHVRCPFGFGGDIFDVPFSLNKFVYHLVHVSSERWSNVVDVWYNKKTKISIGNYTAYCLCRN